MLIEKVGVFLNVTSNIYFDDKECFCGRPYAYLAASKNRLFDAIGIAIRDNDDYDIGLSYTTNDENFTNVLHELINWMRDHEQGISSYEKMACNTYEFFPDLSCKRKRW